MMQFNELEELKAISYENAKLQDENMKEMT